MRYVYIYIYVYSYKAVPVLLYMGQVCSPPTGVNAVEALQVSKILGFAATALNHDSIFPLDALGGLKMPRPSFAMVAADFVLVVKLFRTVILYLRS